jgi:hypothetical protein
MRKMNDLVKDVLSLNTTDLELLAKALAVYDIRKADRMKFFLTTHIIEEDMRRLKDYNAMKEAV